jgi:hypothetical protein
MVYGRPTSIGADRKLDALREAARLSTRWHTDFGPLRVFFRVFLLSVALVAVVTSPHHLLALVGIAVLWGPVWVLFELHMTDHARMAVVSVIATTSGPAVEIVGDGRPSSRYSLDEIDIARSSRRMLGDAYWITVSPVGYAPHTFVVHAR